MKKTAPMIETEAAPATALKILVVEDDKLARNILGIHLKGHRVEFADNFAAGRKLLDSGAHDLCFIDLNLGDEEEHSGLKLIPLAASKGAYPVVMSSAEAEEVVGKAYELGCRDYFVKGNEEANVAAVLAKYRRSKTSLDLGRLFKDRFVTEDPVTRAGVLDALKYSATDLPILILGPSGTGKTCLGQIIHEQSGREGEFVALNCAAYTEELLEAELFGHKKGAFTGASESRKGRLLEAHKGTLFLDEVGAMSLGMQAKLLKAIEERSFHPVGSDRAERSEFRLISATLEDPQKLIADGKLRFDFFQRIHGFTVDLKPLAERPRDILPLVQFFTRGGKRLHFSADAKNALLGHSWPGNTRELKKVVELLAAGSEGRVTADEVRKHFDREALGAETASSAFVHEHQYRHAVEHGLDDALERFAGEVIRRSLTENKDKKTKTMKALKISARRLYAALKDREG
jgi:DNA-binding NtrC family response regulator